MIMPSKHREHQYIGLEVEIMKALGKAMNFNPQLYETSDAEHERWGRLLQNGSYTGLIGEIVGLFISIFNT